MLSGRVDNARKSKRNFEVFSTARRDSTIDTILLHEHPNYPFLISSADQVIRCFVSENGYWEAGLVERIASLLPSRPRIVIGGGHIGLLAFQLWRARPEAVDILVFEPASVNAGLLSLNIFSWGRTPVRALPLALGARTQVLSLARNPVNSGDNRLWDRIPPDLDAGGGNPDEWTRERVVTVALDDVWNDSQLDLLLLDTQGWEPEALYGAKRVVQECRPLVVFEWWPQALAARGIDTDAFLSWAEHDLELTMEALPPEAAGFSNPDIRAAAAEGNIQHLTQLLLVDPDPTAYIELLAYPRENRH